MKISIDKDSIKHLSSDELDSVIKSVDNLFDEYYGLLFNQSWKPCILKEDDESIALRDELISLRNEVSILIMERDKIKLDAWKETMSNPSLM